MIKKSILTIITANILTSCNYGREFDLAKVEFNKEYNIKDLAPTRISPQKGHFETASNKTLEESVIKGTDSDRSLILAENGEKVTNYYFDDVKANSNLNYAELPLDSDFGTTLTEYNGKVAFIALSVKKEQTFKLIKYLLNRLHKPSEVITNELNIDEISTEIAAQLKQDFPNETKRYKNDIGNEAINYPETIYWKENDVVYKLVLFPSNDKISNTLAIYTKQAIKDKFVFGYGTEKDSIFNK